MIGDHLLTTQNDTGIPPPTSIYIVCSPRTSVGKTLIARLLVEFHNLSGRAATAFDVNPNEPALVHYLPGCTRVASIGNTRGQIALFDRLITADGILKVIDVAADNCDAFFKIMHVIGFCEEAHARSIVPVVLYVANPRSLSAHVFDAMRQNLKHLLLVPVYNDFLKKAPLESKPFLYSGLRSIRIPLLSAYLSTETDKHTFSFAKFLRDATADPTDLRSWIKRCFIEFRELELRLLISRLRLFKVGHIGRTMGPVS